MVEVAGHQVTSVWADYGSTATCVALRDSSTKQSLRRTAAGDEEAEWLLVKLNDERRVVVVGHGRALVTVVILTAINLLNYTDRYIIAGQFSQLLNYTCRHITI